MEHAGVISSSTRDRHEAENEHTDERNPSVQLQKVYEPPKLYFGVCTTPLTKLRRTTLVELRANEPTLGFYLLLRTVGPILRGTYYIDFGQNVTVPVEDHAKNRSTCCLYGHVHLKSERELTDLLPVNTVFVLKEPLLLASEQNVTVVVGSPSDFVVVGRSHVLYEEAEALGWREKMVEDGIHLTSKWKQIGDDLFEKGKHQEAVDAYLFPLNNGGDDETNLLLNINLAQCFLAQNCYESAIKHALDALRVQPLDEHALYLAGRAFYELRRFSEAKPYFKNLAQALPSDEHVLGELERCEHRLNESEGNVDIPKLFRACLSGPKPIDVGSFVGGFEFQPDPGNGRGVSATKDLEPGTLILVEKPVVAIYEPPRSSDRGLVKFMRAVLKTVSKNPQTLGRKLYSLPGGGIQVGENRRTFCDEVRELEPIVDVCSLYLIIDRNILKFSNSMEGTYQVYESASRFRQSCLSNCTFVVYNDVITIRTCSPVQKGEELFLRYCDNRLTFHEKRNALERLGLTCSCFLCGLDKMELPNVHDLRDALRSLFNSEIGVHFSVSSHAVKNIVRTVRELELTYKNRKSLRLLLFFVYCDLAKAIEPTSRDWEFKVTLYLEKGLKSVGLSTALLLSCVEQANPQLPQYILVPEVLFEYAGLMVEMEYSGGRMYLVEKWVKVIFLLEKIYRGGNLEMLQNRFLSFRMVPFLLSAFAKNPSY